MLTLDSKQIDASPLLHRQVTETANSTLFTINRGELKQRVLAAIADEYSREILKATIDAPISASELTKRYDIPVTTVYRRIEELVEAGLIASVKSGRTKEGKWFDLYRSLVKRIDLHFEGELRIDLIINEEVAKFWRMKESIPKQWSNTADIVRT
jgi:DNA-binding transcriptional ArsR family regulator